MLGFLKQLFSKPINPQLQTILAREVTIIDVRTPLEFKAGHVDTAINVPLATLDSQIERIKKMRQPIVTCCASGHRSGIAEGKLTAAGIEAYNGGGWKYVQKHL